MTPGRGTRRNRRGMWITGGASASLAVVLTCGAAAGAVAMEPERGAPAPLPAERCERDRDRPQWSKEAVAEGLASLFSVWGLGDRTVRGCDGEWDRCRDQSPSWPPSLPGGGREDAAPGREGQRPQSAAEADQAAAHAGTAPRAATRGGTCETRDGLTEAVGDIVTVPAGGSAASTAVCPAGTTAVSGGWSTVEPGLVQGVSQRLGSDSWRVVFDNPTAGELSGLAFAYCADDED
ncbi:hypothetical protein [Streptomyces chilikensis]|uniref:Secreted protein n=1 Tax=Streptomyces chilikensis TaxID=1194079 RepID=A0ABV3EN75_9ACTN